MDGLIAARECPSPREAHMSIEDGQLKALEAVILYTPPPMRRGHLVRLERLLSEILPDQLYSYEHVFSRITQFQPDSGGDRLLSGRLLQRELGRLLTPASATAPLEATEEMLTLVEVARRYRVAPKTVKRWALTGLPLADWTGPQGRLGLAVRARALESFLDRRRRARAPHGHRLTAAEAEAIRARAEVLAAEAVASGETVRRLASESGYSSSTVRRVLKRLRREAAPVPLPGGITPERCEELVALFRGGTAVAELASRFRLSKATLYRLLHRALMDKILSAPINYIPNPAFARPDADELCLGKDGLFTYPPERPADAPKPPPATPAYLAELYRMPLLSRKREGELFLKYNYIKYRAAMLQERLRRAGYKPGMIEEFESLRNAAEQLKLILVRCNLRLVVSIARRHTGPLAGLFDLVSEGNLCLMRAVECYNCARNARFATYATWAISKHFARVVPEENYRVGAFVTGQQEMIEAAGDRRETARDRTETIEHIRSLIDGAVGRLTPREREVIAAHFGTDGRPARTLEEIGGLFGLTRERIRQIEAKAIQKLRALIPREAAALV
jgi:RNA polymerase sigma factor (sigma-70 family)